MLILSQSFQKIGFLNTLAPAQSELSFVVAHTGLILAFLALAYLAVAKSNPLARARDAAS